MMVYSDDNIIFEISENYYMIKVGNETWYWIRETGKFDGHSMEVSVARNNPVPLPIV